MKKQTVSISVDSIVGGSKLCHDFVKTIDISDVGVTIRSIINNELSREFDTTGDYSYTFSINNVDYPDAREGTRVCIVRLDGEQHPMILDLDQSIEDQVVSEFGNDVMTTMRWQEIFANEYESQSFNSRL